MTDEYAFLDATAQADLVRGRLVKPLELVEAAIARVERLNPRLNAVVTPMFEAALEQARRDGLTGRFAGVPFLLKDLGAPYGGVPHTSGSVLLEDFVPPEDGELVRRYKAAGLIVLGKTNTPEFGLLPVTEPRLFGPARNPWDESRTPGGSSGGSAAAVAARMVPAAHGNDGGGSIRIPAACCGLFGLKPSRGRMPGMPGLADFLPTSHVLSVSVRDSAALLDATWGAEPGAPFALPAPPESFVRRMTLPPGRLRIAFSRRSVAGSGFHADCLAALEDAVRLCAGLGHAVEEAAPAIDAERYVTAFNDVWTAQHAAGLELRAAAVGREPGPGLVEPATWLVYEAGKRVDAARYLRALRAFDEFAAAMARFFRAYDVWLTPTLGAPPVEIGHFDREWADAGTLMRAAHAFAPVTPLFNATGQPAMSVPLYWNAAGLPVGVHFAARLGEEGLLLSLAAQLEEARPWAGRLPDVSA